MPRASFIAIINLFTCCVILSQDIHEVKNYADSQLERGNYSIALKEFQRVLLFDENQEYDDVYAKIASLYYELEDYENALVYFDFAWRTISQDSLKLNYAFKKILCYFSMEKYLLGLADLYDLPDQLPPYYASKRDLYFAICYFGLEDHYESLKHLSELVDSTGMVLLDSTFVILNKYRKKYDPDKLEMMSIFFPGFGQAYAGEFGSAINSLFLLSGITAYSYITMINYTLLDGTLVMINWFYRYYTGGHRKAFDIGEKLLTTKRNETYHKMLDIINTHTLHGK